PRELHYNTARCMRVQQRNRAGIVQGLQLSKFDSNKPASIGTRCRLNGRRALRAVTATPGLPQRLRYGAAVVAVAAA
ncbi:MAG: hypothetical protein WA732_06920, partial [Pseudolabrys sp.]